jgi:hypothetical protein
VCSVQRKREGTGLERAWCGGPSIGKVRKNCAGLGRADVDRAPALIQGWFWARMASNCLENHGVRLILLGIVEGPRIASDRRSGCAGFSLLRRRVVSVCVSASPLLLLQSSSRLLEVLPPVSGMCDSVTPDEDWKATMDGSTP